MRMKGRDKKERGTQKVWTNHRILEQRKSFTHRTSYRVLLGFSVWSNSSDDLFFDWSRSDSNLEFIGIRETLIDASTLPTATTEEVQLCATNLCHLLHLDLDDDRRKPRKDALDTDTIDDFTNGEGTIGKRMTIVNGNDETLENLHALFVSFLNLLVNTYSVARLDHGTILGELRGLKM